MQEKYSQSPYLTQAFKPSAWLANIDFIKRLILLNHLLMVVMSESGGGKSTFVELMCLKLAPGIQSVLLHAEKDEEHHALLTSLVSVLNVEMNAETATWLTFFEAVSVQKQPLLMMIDDAQNMSFEALQQLAFAYKQYGQSKRIFVCLVSDFSLTAALHRLEQTELKRFIHTIEPGMLTETEAKTYMLRYFQGKRDKEVMLRPAQFKSFYSITQGKIAAMNAYLSSQTAGSQIESTQFGARLKKPLIWVVVLIGLGGVIHSLPRMTSAKLVRAELSSAPLKSSISPWHVGLKTALVAPPPLQKFAEIVDDAENQNGLHVVMDKVVVIPDQLNAVG